MPNVELDRLDGGTFQTERLGALAATVTADALHLVAARQRVRIVLQRDDASHRAAAGRHHHEAAFDQARGGGQRHGELFRSCLSIQELPDLVAHERPKAT